jgi:hypothetical protein
VKIKTIEEYNEAWNYLGWLAIKPEHGGSQKFNRKKFDEVKKAIEDFEATNQQIEHKAMKKRKCPKCKKTVFAYIEVWKNHTMSFDCDRNGYWDGEDGFSAAGEPDHVNGYCLCGHIWRIKGVRQITELKPPDQHKEATNEGYRISK